MGFPRINPQVLVGDPDSCSPLFRDTLHNIHAITPSGDEATRILLEAMFDRLMDQLSLIKAERKARGYLGNSNMPDNIFDTGKQFLLQRKKHKVTMHLLQTSSG